MATKQEQEEKEEQEFLAKKAKESDETAKKPAKGKEPWRFKLVSGKAHPDNKPPVTVIAEASDDAREKYEASINAEREKLYPAPAEDSEDNGKSNGK